MTTEPTTTEPAGAGTGVPDTATGDGQTGAGDAPRAQRPSLGRVVVYSDPQIPGSQRLAHVTGTRDSIVEYEGVPLPADDMHVHVKVMPPAGSIYDAHDVAYDANGAPGTWRWPTRVGA